MISVVAIDECNWRGALAVAVTAAQAPYVTEYEPIALSILAKAYVRPNGEEWEPIAFADRAGQIVGVAALVHAPPSCRVRNFAIDAHHQSTGLGRDALAALIEHVRTSRPACTSLVVSFHPDNEPARRLYVGAGFVVTEVQANGEPFCVLALRRG